MYPAWRSSGKMVIMARLTVDSERLTLRLSPLEKLGALHGDVHVPLADVESVSLASRPWIEVRGARAPGTGFPGLIKLGTMRGGFGKDFVVVYGGRPVVLVGLRNHEFARLLVRTRTPDTDVRNIERRIHEQHTQRGDT